MSGSEGMEYIGKDSEIANAVLDKISDDWHEALDVIEELLKFGSHEGRCTNIDAPEERCTKHYEAACNRRERAKEFISLFRGHG